MSNPHLKTDLPGPKSKAMLARDFPVASPSYPRDYPFVMSHGRGTEVWDVDGNRFLDFSSQLVNANIGHQHPRMVEAIKEQADKLCTIAPFHRNCLHEIHVQASM